MKTSLLILLAALTAYLVALLSAVSLTAGPVLFLIGSLALVATFRLAQFLAEVLDP